MKGLSILLLLCSLLSLCCATILENGQARKNPYPGQAPQICVDDSWERFSRNAPEILYKGRWDSDFVSWWSLPGFTLGFNGHNLGIEFGPKTSKNVLVAYRVGGLDWQFANVTANATYQFFGQENPVLEGAKNTGNKQFELRVQIQNVFLDKGSRLMKPAEFHRMVEIIGDSYASGQYATYEGLSSWAYNFVAGLGNVEYSITAYPGICLVDNECYGGKARGMRSQWYSTIDVGDRAKAAYGDRYIDWDIKIRKPADMVIINLGTNDHRNNITGEEFFESYVKLIDGVRKAWPKAEVVMMSLWGTFEPHGDTWIQKKLYEKEIDRLHDRFKGDGFGFFDTTGILQHNDIAPSGHPTDIGHIKLASHLLQWVKILNDWELGTTGPEVQAETLYWNNEEAYK